MIVTPTKSARPCLAPQLVDNYLFPSNSVGLICEATASQNITYVPQLMSVTSAKAFLPASVQFALYSLFSDLHQQLWQDIVSPAIGKLVNPEDHLFWGT